jgi:hypothetical protein
MNLYLQFILFTFAGWVNRHQQAVVEYLRHPMIPCRHAQTASGSSDDGLEPSPGWTEWGFPIPRVRASVFGVWCRSAVLTFVLLASSGRAWANSDDVYLQYSASEGCPTRAEFEDQVRARTARARFLDKPGEERFFRVYASVLDGHAVGSVISGASNAPANMREVASNDCQEVVSALALIVALAIDPQASMSLSHPSAPEPSPTAVLRAPDSPGAAPMMPQTFTTAPASSSWVDRSGLPKHSSSSDVALSVGARVEGAIWWSAGAIPMGTWALSLEGENTEARLVAPAVRLSVEHTESAAVNRAEGGARFANTAGRLDACPFRFRLAPNVSVRPCVALEAGQLSATGLAGSSVVNTLTQHRPWWVLGGSLRVQFWLTKAWSSELEAVLDEPLWRDEFVFLRASTGPESKTITKTPVLVPRIGVGTAVHF